MLMAIHKLKLLRPAGRIIIVIIILDYKGIAHVPRQFPRKGHLVHYMGCGDTSGTALSFGAALPRERYELVCQLRRDILLQIARLEVIRKLNTSFTGKVFQQIATFHFLRSSVSRGNLLNGLLGG